MEAGIPAPVRWAEPPNALTGSSFCLGCSVSTLASIPLVNNRFLSALISVSTRISVLLVFSHASVIF